MEYIIIEADDADICAEFVNEEIRNGFEPYGGLAVSRWEYPGNPDGADYGWIYVQAMIKGDSQQRIDDLEKQVKIDAFRVR